MKTKKKKYADDEMDSQWEKNAHKLNMTREIFYAVWTKTTIITL